jgi:hypothetical protein
MDSHYRIVVKDKVSSCCNLSLISDHSLEFLLEAVFRGTRTSRAGESVQGMN